MTLRKAIDLCKKKKKMQITLAGNLKIPILKNLKAPKISMKQDAEAMDTLDKIILCSICNTLKMENL